MTQKKNVHECVSAVMAALAKQGIGKNQKNTHDNYKFRGIDDVYNALAGNLSANGLNIYPSVESIEETERASFKGNAVFYKMIKVKYTLVSSHDMSDFCVIVYGEAMDRGDKAINKALSAAYKNMAFQVFCIPIEGSDSEEESHEVGSVVQPHKPAERKPNPNAAREFVNKAKMQIESFQTLEQLREYTEANSSYIGSLAKYEGLEKEFNDAYNSKFAALQGA